MNILVCVNQIPDTTSKINFTADNSAFDETGIQFILNPSDESALNKAIQIKEKTSATVTILHAGTPQSDPVLRKAFAIGANQIIRVNTIPTDGFSVAKNIASVVKDRNFDLILCGKESLDFHGGMVGGILAEFLNYNFVNNVKSFSLDNENITVQRETETGITTYITTLPAVLAVQKEIVPDAELKIPNIRGIMVARTAPIEVVEVNETTTSLAFSNYEKPAPKSPVKIINANDLDSLIDELQSVILK